MTSTSDSFVPIVSSSPPPIDFGSSEDEDDEFGTFSAAKVEFDSPPGKANRNQGDDKHFFPIDIPSEDQNDNFQSLQSKPKDGVLPVSTTSLENLSINDGEDVTRTSTQITNYKKFQGSTTQGQPLPNGILHPGSFDDSSESLEFVQNEDNVHIKKENFLQESDSCSIDSGDEKKKEDLKECKQFDRREKLHGKLDHQETSSESMKCDLEDQSGGNWAAFDTFHEKANHSPVSVTETKTDTSSTSSSPGSMPDNSEMKVENVSSMNESVNQREPTDLSVQQSISKELPSESLGMPSVAMENCDDDDEFGDFGSFTKDVQSKSDNKPVTDSKSEFKRIGTNDDFGDFGSFESKPVTGAVDQEFIHSKGDVHNPASAIKGSDSSVSEKGQNLKLANVPKGLNDDDFADDDDFAEFSAFKSDTKETAKAEEGTSHMTDSKDSFAEFGAFKTKPSTTDATTGGDWANFDGSGSHSQTVDDSFGDFGSFKVSNSNLKDGFDGGDDDFASFESSGTSSVSGGGSLRINQVFNGCFPNSISKAYPALSISLQPLSGLICQSKDSPPRGFEANGAGLKISTKSTNGLGVWSVLSDMENTKAMGYQWTKSDSKKKLLSSLGLDERNILTSRVGGVPKFASDLGMLQPIKPGEPTLQAEAAPRMEEAFPPELRALTQTSSTLRRPQTHHQPWPRRNPPSNRWMKS